MPDITRDGWLLADILVRSYAAGLMGVRPLRIREKVQCGVESPQASLRVHYTIDRAGGRLRELVTQRSSCSRVIAQFGTARDFALVHAGKSLNPNATA